jgi:hypothetical protein
MGCSSGRISDFSATLSRNIRTDANCSLIEQLRRRSIDIDFDLHRVSGMAIEYRIALRDRGWMIEREGQLYGPYSSKQEAVHEAVYVANYAINRGLQAEVIVQEAFPRIPDRLITAFRTIAQPVISPFR